MAQCTAATIKNWRYSSLPGAVIPTPALQTRPDTQLDNLRRHRGITKKRIRPFFRNCASPSVEVSLAVRCSGERFIVPVTRWNSGVEHARY